MSLYSVVVVAVEVVVGEVSLLEAVLEDMRHEGEGEEVVAVMRRRTAEGVVEADLLPEAVDSEVGVADIRVDIINLVYHFPPCVISVFFF